jgi:tetratricopeptide (TPR) repeat protein
VDDQTPESKSNWLSRLRERFKPRGDVIVANIGEGAQDVIVGKNVIKIGTLVVPATPVFVGVVILLALIGLAAYLYFVPDKMPEGRFNVAVAEFGELDANGDARSTANGQLFSRYIFDTLRGEMDELRPNLPGVLKPNIWHDSLFPTGMRARIGLMPGKTRDARRDAAIQRAADLRANVVIYGNLASHQTPAAFVPEFYVAPIAGEADEIVGRYQFGAPISVSLSGDEWAKSLPLNNTLAIRQKALAYFTLGLTYDLSGLHADALDLFASALSIIEKSENREGEEILRYFIGRQHLFLAQKKYLEVESFNAQAQAAVTDADKPAWRAKAQEALSKVEQSGKDAEAQFLASRQANPNYAKAYYGLGGLARLRAQIQSPRERFEKPEFLSRALDEYRQALAKATADEPQTPLKVQMAMGGIYFLQGEASLHQFDYNAASDAFDNAIKLVEAQLPRLEQQPRTLAEAYLTLGSAYFEKGIAKKQLNDSNASRQSFDQAIQYYSKCIELKKYDDETLITLGVARCERYRTQVQAQTP